MAKNFKYFSKYHASFFSRQFAILEKSPCANRYFADLFHFVLVNKNLKVMLVCLVSSFRILTGRKVNTIKF